MDLITILKSSQKIAVLSGAGVSQECGIPAYREAQTGLWSCFDPHKLASPETFRNIPKLVWEWYECRKQVLNQIMLILPLHKSKDVSPSSHLLLRI